MKRNLTRSQKNLREFVELPNSSNFSKDSNVSGFGYLPKNIWHIYLHLEFESRYESAENLEDAKSFLRNVGKATQVSEKTAKAFDGAVLEAQGSTIHIAIPHESEKTRSDVSLFCYSLHQNLTKIFAKSQKVKAWRFTSDHGNTLVVNGRGIHGDQSSVSLGNSANRPAKKLYSELAKNLEEQSLKRFHYGEYWRGTWSYIDLHDGQVEIPNTLLTERAKDLVFDEKDLDVTVGSFLLETSARTGIINASTGDINPDNDEPQRFFGWTMRADLDGFTSRVETCFDDDAALRNLANDFLSLMDDAANFSESHTEHIVQLPWAGDNFTAIAQYDNKEDYIQALQTKPIELSLDFEDTMHLKAAGFGFGGWAQSVSGGDIHGNATGNVFLGSVSFPGRRFLLGAGKGIGMSIRGFSEMNPKPRSIAILGEDRDMLVKPYKDCLMDNEKENGQSSTLFRKGVLHDLATAKAEVEMLLGHETPKAKITVPSVGKATVRPRPYLHEQSKI
ncbi:MAG: hypothetical protein Q7Q71_14390 [Verrucomicrobiota bacterium JB023]|nr:hypothetical protein [Verrucomicrobiota bacterium JB023]